MEKKILNYLAWGFVIAIALVLFFYLRATPASEPIQVGEGVVEIDVIEGYDEVMTSEGWLDVELVDVITGESFRLSDFNVPVVLESFAVWCPTCKRQQDEIQKLIDSGDESAHVSINTDPNEDAARVVKHINRYEYTWPFVVFPASATQMLVDDFGIGVVNAPRAPVVVICPDGMARLLQSGVKTANELKEEVEKC